MIQLNTEAIIGGVPSCGNFMRVQGKMQDTDILGECLPRQESKLILAESLQNGVSLESKERT